MSQLRVILFLIVKVFYKVIMGGSGWPCEGLKENIWVQIEHECKLHLHFHATLIGYGAIHTFMMTICLATYTESHCHLLHPLFAFTFFAFNLSCLFESFDCCVSFSYNLISFIISCPFLIFFSSSKDCHSGM